MHLPTVVFLLPAAVCALSWLGAGLVIPKRFVPAEALLGWLTRVAFGSVAVSLLVLALGRAGYLDRPILIVLTLLGALAGASALPAIARLARVVPRGGRFRRLLLGLVGVALLLDLVASTAPPTSADALKYHLALPRLWLQQGSIGDPFWRWEGFNPSGIEMLYTQGLALAGGSAAAPLHAVLAILCALAIYGLCRELGGNDLAGIVAMFLFVLQGIVTWEATSAFIELGLTLYVMLAVWYVARWARDFERRDAFWAGFLIGAAAGTKYVGLGPAAIVLGCMGVVGLRRRHTGDTAIAAGAALVAGGAWYVKNAVVAGNPLYPIAFGGKWLTPYADHLIRDLPYGVGGALWRLALLPAELLLHGGAFDRGQYVGPAVFVFAILALVTVRTCPVAVVCGGCALYTLGWWEESPQARFLLPVLAVLAAVGGVGAARWLRATVRRRAAIVVVLVCVTAAWLAASVALTRQLLPVTIGLESRGAFLQRLTGTYDVLRQVRARIGAGTLGLAGYQFAYNVPGRAVTIDVPEFQPSVRRSVYLMRLRSLGVGSILVGGGLGASPVLDPIRNCLTREADYQGRFVTSRSLGQSIPYQLVLYSVVGCSE